MHSNAEAEMRFRTAELALVQARRRRAALRIMDPPTNRTEVLAQMDARKAVHDQERRATDERARALRRRYLPEMVA